MTARETALTALEAAAQADPTALLRAAAEALKHDAAAQVAVVLEPATRRYPADARLWQFLGLARRALQDSAGAHHAFNRAAELAPADPLIAHSQARTALESGYPAIALFNRARTLAPGDGDVALGRAAAQLAENSGGEACAQLSALLEANPGWVEGHVALARLSAQVNPAMPLDATVAKALKRHPQAGALWQVRLRILMEARYYAATLPVLGEARAALGPSLELDRIEAICRTELNEPEAAQALFNRLPIPSDPEAAIWLIRNCARLGRYDEALALAERSYPGHSDAPLWPYRSLLWRLTDDDRWHWLEGDSRLVSTFDLAAEVGSIEDLADLLRRLHVARGQPLDQSVRGGTQTDGNLLARAEPELRRLRQAFLQAVGDYVGSLPPADPTHPVLGSPRGDLRVAGAWSVRLTGGGFHADHVHYQGWISSAFYVVVPDEAPDGSEAGWLALGQCQDLLPALPAFRTIRPEPGKLVLFPSIMWHGTRPFGSGERMTVAFDIAQPGPAR